MTALHSPFFISDVDYERLKTVEFAQGMHELPLPCPADMRDKQRFPNVTHFAFVGGECFNDMLHEYSELQPCQYHLRLQGTCVCTVSCHTQV